MTKQKKPLSSKKPPVPNNDHTVITEWMEGKIMPPIKPVVEQIDELIKESIPDLQFSIKWGCAFYGTKDHGWLIEVAAYAVSVNVVFLNGANISPQPPMGDGETRYIKLTTPEEISSPQLANWVKQAAELEGWK